MVKKIKFLHTLNESLKKQYISFQISRNHDRKAQASCCGTARKGAKHKMNYLNVAKEAAEKAGKIAMQYFGKEMFIETKKHESDIVTEADKKAEKVIIATIKKTYPEHHILSEEMGYTDGSDDVTWYVDPIDGTQNFANKVPLFCVSVGVEQKGEMVAAAINVPAMGELFTAVKGKGVFLNNKPVQVSPEKMLRRGLVVLNQKDNVPQDVLSLAVEHQQLLSDKVGALRNFGTCALQLAMVSKGSFVGYIEQAARMWDMAAGNFLVQEAGGTVTDLEGKPWKPKRTKDNMQFIASNGLVHDQIVEILKKN